MKLKFVSDGELRLHDARAKKLREIIREKYSAEFARANFFQGFALRSKVAAEVRHELRRNLPSPYSLYLSR
jgi:hypothetical protein